MAPARNMEYPVAGSTNGVRLVTKETEAVRIYGANPVTEYIWIVGLVWILSVKSMRRNKNLAETTYFLCISAN